MEKDLHIAIDGGGTKTIGVLFRKNGEILKVIRREFESNVWISKKGVKDKTLTRVLELINDLKKDYLGELKTITFTIPGFTFVNEIEKSYPTTKVTLVGDHEAAHLACFCGEDGICLSIGTGVFSVYFCDNNRTPVILGGWGPLEEDTGSGYYAGLCLLKHLMKDFENDDYSEESKLLIEKWNIDKADIRIDLSQKLYGKNCKSRRDIAALSHIVSSQAEKGSKISIDILDKCGRELADLVYRTYLRKGGDKCPYSVVGGFKKAGKYLLDPLFDQVNKLTDKIYYVEPKFDNYIGSVLYALKLNGVKISKDSDAVKNVIESIKKI